MKDFKHWPGSWFWEQYDDVFIPFSVHEAYFDIICMEEEEGK